MFTKVLIANRGEIACRIIKTAKRLNIATIAVYSTADHHSLHVREADEAYCIGEARASDSYLNIEAIINVGLRSGAQAIHPGYGFLSENTTFAKACHEAGLVFIGPSIEALRIMGSKQLAKQCLEKAKIPLIPGFHGQAQDDETLLKEAKRIGFPVLLKAAAGGGGKGMRSVMQEADFLTALTSARREAQASFADSTMIIEKLFLNPRHIEIQIMADKHGQVVHLFERDCSIQRRHQKIIEEAPAPGLTLKARETLTHTALLIAQSIAYCGAGTIEFLVDEQDGCYFMEMNTRLQVEHPVTEMITGLDLVEWQLRIAAGERLPCSQADIVAKGHAMECRIYAEDPSQGFLPATGTVHLLKEPEGSGIRIDSGIEADDTITLFYDAMIAKLITWGSDRPQALARMQQALAHYIIGGIKTNIPFLTAITHQPTFIKGAVNTHFLTDEAITLPSVDETFLVQLAASMDYIAIQSTDDALLRDTFCWQNVTKPSWYWTYALNHHLYTLQLHPLNAHQLTIENDEQSITLTVHHTHPFLMVDDGLKKHRFYVETRGKQHTFYTMAGPIVVARCNAYDENEVIKKAAGLSAPMQASVINVLKQPGEKVKAGEALVVLEAMKMEHTIYAPTDGQIKTIFYPVGAQVKEGEALLMLEDADESQ